MKKLFFFLIILFISNITFAQQWGNVTLTSPDPIPDPLKKDGTEYWFTFTYDDLSDENETAANASYSVTKGTVTKIEGPYYNGSLFQFKFTFDGDDEIEFSVTATNELGHNQGTWHSGNLALPIELTRFEVEKKGQAFQLQWETASEINNEYFGIERSFNGKSFKKIAEIKGAGNSSEATTYDFLDETIEEENTNKIVYYRLSQTDFDGKMTFSNIISAKIESNHSLIINKTRQSFDNISLDYYSGDASEIRLTLFDISGKILLINKLKPEKGLNTTDMSTQSLPSGMYFINLTNRNTSVTKQIVTY